MAGGICCRGPKMACYLDAKYASLKDNRGQDVTAEFLLELGGKARGLM